VLLLLFFRRSVFLSSPRVGCMHVLSRESVRGEARVLNPSWDDEKKGEREVVPAARVNGGRRRAGPTRTCCALFFGGLLA
jgi:hypothetical protein